MTGIIVKRDEFQFNEWVQKQHAKACQQFEDWGMDPKLVMDSELGWILCLAKFKDKAMELDLFQVGMALNQSKFRAMLKARQIGFSFFIALESLSRCHLKDRHTAVCVSYNLDDAKEKVTIVKELHEELPLEFQKKIVIDSKTQVGFQSNSSKRRISKVISNPAKAPRGKSGDVYLDELAHCLNDREIYAGATALISRSGGQLTTGSTPMGQQGLFYDIWTKRDGEDGFPDFTRQKVPWWLCRHFSKIADNEALIGLCETMPTKERVYRYGTEKIIEQFNALPLEDFQQEFECAFQDEKVAFFPYHLIDPCLQQERSRIPVYTNIRLLADVAAKLGPLYIGFDVGRSNHPSEIFVFEKMGSTYILRYEQSLKNLPFPRQREICFEIGDMLGKHWRKFRIDETGLGKNLAEDLQRRYGHRVEGVTFTAATKEALANNLRILFEERNIVLPRDRGIRAQIHAIKQRYTSAGNAVFDAERNRTHHADKMWAIALAVLEKRQKIKVATEVNIRMTGQKPRSSAIEQKIENTPRNLDPQEHGLVTALCTLPGEAGKVVAGPNPFPSATEIVETIKSESKLYKESTTEELREVSQDLAVAMRVYKRNGDEEKFTATRRRYQRLRRELSKR